jgi:hypothetical protein
MVQSTQKDVCLFFNQPHIIRQESLLGKPVSRLCHFHSNAFCQNFSKFFDLIILRYNILKYLINNLFSLNLIGRGLNPFTTPRWLISSSTPCRCNPCRCNPCRCNPCRCNPCRCNPCMCPYVRM